MYLGRIVEHATTDDVFYHPKHPYTVGLLNSIPKIGDRKKEKLAAIKGVVPQPLDLPPCCGFHERCERMIPGLCDEHDVPIATIADGHSVRCFLYPEVMELHEKRSAADE